MYPLAQNPESMIDKYLAVNAFMSNNKSWRMEILQTYSEVKVSSFHESNKFTELHFPQ